MPCLNSQVGEVIMDNLVWIVKGHNLFFIYVGTDMQLPKMKTTIKGGKT